MCTSIFRAVILTSGLLSSTLSQCPLSGISEKELDKIDYYIGHPSTSSAHTDWESRSEALKSINFTELQLDIKSFLVTSKALWPADFGDYGPFMIRQAWHCAGSYRSSDGRGGCNGARQRFDPELSWMDNTNLDKAKKLLWPLKLKYGSGLSWGDLIILTGTVAIRSMGGPVLGFCAGRTDDDDGSASNLLGPTPEQEAVLPCAVNGDCQSPLGATTIGLIYVNPGGPMGNHTRPDISAEQIREVFSRMTLNDSETVALIGGGHAFGKTHGACPSGAGPSPKEDPANPWPGLCGTGKGGDTFTSGFEGSWTTTPTKWGNEYFKNLIEEQWEAYLGPGGVYQWRPVNPSHRGVIMLTSDIALLHDPLGVYQSLVRHYAGNLAALEYDFAHAWYKLTTRDFGPATRCAGPLVPPPQDFQYPLPPTPKILANFKDVKAAIKKVILTDSSNVLTPDIVDGHANYVGVYVSLAWQCASTFRTTDKLGGCNGARIRFPPQSHWPANKGLDKALFLLNTIKKKFGDALSWADLIVLAGNVALELAGAPTMPFCGGRTDATNGKAWAHLSPNGDYSTSTADFVQSMRLLGLTDRELVVLAARPRSAHQMGRLGYVNGTWSSKSGELTNHYFRNLINHDWKTVTSATGLKQFRAETSTGPLFMVPQDLNIKYDPVLLAQAQEYASDSKRFVRDFVSAWTKVMNSDRFDGPYRNLCDKSA